MPKLTPVSAFKLAMALYRAGGGRDARLEAIFIQEPYYVYWYTANVIQQPWPEAEPVFSKVTAWTYHYANEVLHLSEQDARRWLPN